jgi:Tfp pilus assembly protein PilX
MIRQVVRSIPPFEGTPARGSIVHAERGAVLVVGLVMLAVMTLLVVSMIKTSVVELKIGGANQIAQQNLTNAEFMINNFVDVNNGRFASNYLPLATASGGPVKPASASSTYNPTTTVLTVVPISVHSGTAGLQVRQIQCSDTKTPGTQMGGTVQHVFFDVQSTATGTLGGSTTVHQGIRSMVPAGSC